jgi:hypothetical protein
MELHCSARCLEEHARAFDPSMAAPTNGASQPYFLAHDGTTKADLLAASVTTVWIYKIRASDGEKWRVAFQRTNYALVALSTLNQIRFALRNTNFPSQTSMFTWADLIRLKLDKSSCPAVWFWWTPTSAASLGLILFQVFQEGCSSTSSAAAVELAGSLCGPQLSYLTFPIERGRGRTPWCS